MTTNRQIFRRIIYACALVLAAAALFLSAFLLGGRPEPRSLTALLETNSGTSFEPPTKFPAAKRIVAVGDLHGDLAITRAVLRLAGAIDSSDRWIGGNLVLVQLGDAVDRGDDDREILDLFVRLEKEAADADGMFHPLLGNHEIMNIAGNYKYVNARAMIAFDDLAPGFLTRPETRDFPPAQRGRAAAFRPGGPVAAALARHNVVTIVGDNVFVHGGVLPEHVTYDLDRINRETKSYVRGQTDSLPSIMTGQSSPIWTRLYSLKSVLARSTCETLKSVLNSLEASRMIVGHTVQEQGINSACERRVFRIDTGMSAAYHGSRPSALEIVGDRVTPLVGERP
jgi:hypothetical protein